MSVHVSEIDVSGCDTESTFGLFLEHQPISTLYVQRYVVVRGPDSRRSREH